jgi:hypothetical protein
MIDSAPEKRVRVSSDATTGPYIISPVDQLLEIREVLDRNDIRYWVDEDAISLNDQPAVSVINLGRGVDADYVQKLLDAKQ